MVIQILPKKQISSLVKICKILIKRYKIKKKNIIGHSDISPLRKKDPGEKFPWEYLAKKKIGIWHDYKPNFLKKFRKKKVSKKHDELKFIKNINKLLVIVFLSNKKFLMTKIVKAFQRHYRKELINGLLDNECLIIAQNLRKKL